MKHFYINFYSIIIFSLIILSGFNSTLTAQLKVSQVIGDGAVLQRDVEIPVWGKSAINDTITVFFKGIERVAIADSNGKWIVSLPPNSAGGPDQLRVYNSSQTITFQNIYVGDVWLASGQSNMEMTVSNADSASSVIAAANDQMIRQFKVPKGLANELSDELPVNSNWTPATSQYVGNFSAVGYHFANNLRKHIDIPIGILNVTNGGSRIETWMSEDMLGYDESDIVLANGEPERQPTLAFNQVINPLLPFPIKGVIWYQGESNADNMEDAVAYEAIFQTMITKWREAWGLGDFPFLWVQLPNFGTVYDQPQNWDAWPQLRAGQTASLKLPNTGEAITIDVGDVDIHPTYKQPVGYRLSLLARKIAYGEDIVDSGPRYKSNFLREDGKVVINYDYLGSGLLAKDSANGEITGFAMAGDNGQLAWANAVIDSDQVIVWNDDIPEPSIVRYAWEYNPANVNLYNNENLPAAPFLANVNPGFKIAVFESGRSAIETGQSTTLEWLVFGASSVTLDGVSVDTIGTINIMPIQDTTYTLIAINKEDSTEIDTATVTVEVLDPDQINRALNHSVTASTWEACCGDSLLPELAIDGNSETRWSSAWQEESSTTVADPNLDDNPNDEWISIDMGETIDIQRVILDWEGAYGSGYDIDVSYDSYIWTTVFEERAGNGEQDNIVFDIPVSGRFIRIHGIERATQYGFSLWEISVYGVVSELKPPSVRVGTNLGNVVVPETELILTAETVDSDGSVVSADFYANGVLLLADDSEPFETSFTSSTADADTITVLVTDDDGITVQSDPYIIYSDNGSITHFEAEDASYTGQGTVQNSGAVSGGQFLDMQDAWTITFNNVGVPEAGEYLMTFGYQLTYESPKTQYLVVNQDTVSEVEFTAPSTTAWLQKGLMVSLKEGVNEIAIHGFWNWMSFDFIGIKGGTIVSVKENSLLPRRMSLSQNYPNPFNPTTKIRYSVANNEKAGLPFVKIKIFDILGREITTLVNKEQNAGNYELNWNASNFASGIYYYQMQAGNFLETKKMILVK